MNVKSEKNNIPESLFNTFINPILNIDPVKPDHHVKLKELIESIDLDKDTQYKDVIIKNFDFLLDQPNKQKILFYLDSISPPKNAFLKTSFREFIGLICRALLKHDNMKNLVELTKINDIFLEYFGNHFGHYSIKFYQNDSSLTELIYSTKVEFDKIVGYNNYTISHNTGLSGYQYDSFKSIINDEISVLIYFNQNNIDIFPHNNIYISFGIWKESLSDSAVSKVVKIIENYISFPNIRLKKLYAFDDFGKSSLPENLSNSLELLVKSKNINFNDEKVIIDVSFKPSINVLPKVIQKLDHFNRKYEKGEETKFQNDLARFFEGGGFLVEENFQVEGGGHVDLLIDQEISMQLKIVDNKSLFDDVTGQAINDLERYSISMAVIYDLTRNRRYYRDHHQKNKKGIFYYVFY